MLKPIIVTDTTSEEKRETFKKVFADCSYFTHNTQLRTFQYPQEDEITGSSKGNLNAKTQGALHNLARVPDWLLRADIAASKGIIAPDTVIELETRWRSNTAGDPGTIMEDLEQQAAQRGMAPLWQNIAAAPIYLLNDDTKTGMTFSKEGVSVPLTFDRLIEAGRATGDASIAALVDAVREIAAYMQSARGETYRSHDDALARYLDKMGDQWLFGPDGAPIVDVAGPAAALQGLQALANHFGGEIDDIIVNSRSNVALQPLHDTASASAMRQTAEVQYRFQPWLTIARRINMGNISIHLSDVLIANPDAPPQQQRTVRERLQDRKAEDTMLAREHCCVTLRDNLVEQGVLLHASKRPAPPSQSFPPLGRSETLAVVLPRQTHPSFRVYMEELVRHAFRKANPANNPSMRFLALEDVLEPETDALLQAASARFYIDPASALLPQDANLAHLNRQFVLAALNSEIDGTVGYAEASRTPTFVVGDETLHGTATQVLHGIVTGLYIHGRAKNPADDIFTTVSGLTGAVGDYCRHALSFPATVQQPPVSCPLPSAPHNPVYEGAAPVIVPMYGSAKPTVDSKYPKQVRAIQDAMVKAFSIPGGEQTITLHGEALQRLGKALGVVPNTDDTNGRYGQRLDAALQLMPGCSARMFTDPEHGTACRITAPALSRPVIFTHGGGDHPYDSLSADAPTRNIMGAFADGAYLAVLNGELAFINTAGISTEPLMKLEGRDDAVPKNGFFALAQGINQRTRLTLDCLGKNRATVAAAVYGGIGTAQEMLAADCPLLLIARHINATNQLVIDMREACGLQTHHLNPDAADFAAIIAALAQSYASATAAPADLSVDTMNRAFPIMHLQSLLAR